MHRERLCNLWWHKILLHAEESKVKKMQTIEERMREPYHCTAEASFFLSYLTDSTLYGYSLYSKLIVIKCFNNCVGYRL
jgi:hypothetical protein